MSMNNAGQRFDTTEINVSKHQTRENHRRQKRRNKKEYHVPSWIYRIIVILILCVAGMLVWFNRSNLTPSNIVEWAQNQVVGMGIGDGYPAKLTGSIVSPGNFRSVNKQLVMVGDTELTVLNSSAKQIISRQHSFSNPIMKTNGTRTLIYNLGGKGYQLEAQSKTLIKTNGQQNIIAGALADNGRYALITASDGYYGCLTAYTADNQVQFHYWFSDYYPTAVALNQDGTKAVVTAISTKDGAMTSAVYLLDFSSGKIVDPFAVYPENMMLDAAYCDDGTAVGIGDKLTTVIDTNKRTKANFDYQGLGLSAYYIDTGRIALSLSPYQNSASSRLVVLGKTGQAAVTVNSKHNISSVSLYGDTVAALEDGLVEFYSATTGSSLGSCTASSDAKTIALRDESSVYILGVSEVRLGISK